jgi:tetratricopeptide (TPR) repeat protein
MFRLRAALSILALLILISAAAVPCWPQTRTPPTTDQSVTPPVSSPNVRTYFIRGTLRQSDTNLPADLVHLELSFYNGERAASGTTLHNGEFEFRDLKGGVYTLIAEADGYLPLRERIEVRNASKEGLLIYMRKAAEPLNAPLSPAVSAHFLALPQKAQQAYQKGMQRLYDNKDLKGGLEFFQRSVSAAPNCYEAYCEIGVIHAHLKQFADAENAFRKSIELSDGNFVRADVGLAGVLSNTGRYAEAEPVARKATELNPNMWEALLELARADVGLGHWDAAEKNALAARKINSSAAPLHLLLANIHIHKTDYQAASDDLETFLRIDPDGPQSPKARTTLDEIRKKLGSGNPL